VWALVSVTLLLIGPAIAGTLVMMTGALKMGGAPGLPVVFGNRLHGIRIWADTLVSSGSAYGILTVLVAVAVAVSVTLGQIRRDQQVFDTEESMRPTILERRLDRDDLDVALTGEFVGVVVFGLLSGVLSTVLLFVADHGDAQLFAALVTIAVTLWISLEISRLYLIGRAQDRLAPLLMHSRLRATTNRLRELAYASTEPVSTQRERPGDPATPSLVLLVLGAIDTALQCLFVTRWSDPLIWGITSLGCLMALVVTAIWAGRSTLFDDHRSWFPRVTLFGATLLLASLSFLATLIGLLGSATMTESRVSYALVVAFISWALQSAIVSIILWGAAGYGRYRLLASNLAVKFTRLADGKEPTINSTDHSDTRAMLTTYRPWVLFPILTVGQLVAAAVCLDQPVTQWFVVRALALGILFAALGRLSLDTSNPSRRIFLGTALVGQGIVSVFLVSAQAESGRFVGMVFSSVFWVATIAIYFHSFGPIRCMSHGTVGMAADELAATAAMISYRALSTGTTDMTKALPGCSNIGCVNFKECPDLSVEGAPPAGGCASDKKNHARRYRQWLVCLGAAGTGVWVVRRIVIGERSRHPG